MNRGRDNDRYQHNQRREQDAIEDAYEAGYHRGYKEGYNHGNEDYHHSLHQYLKSHENGPGPANHHVDKKWHGKKSQSWTWI